MGGERGGKSRNRGRHFVVACALALGLYAVGVRFWHDDLRYRTPTPKPVGLAQPELGTELALPKALLARALAGQPLLLHFFNPECPCSRFNLPHLQALVREFGERVSFLVLVQGAEATTATAGFPEAETGISALWDEGGALAARCGVYSTPQAVLLTRERQLYYRGNYNITRFCADEQTAFVRIALRALLEGERLPDLPLAAMTAYGCEVPRGAAPEGR